MKRVVTAAVVGAGLLVPGNAIADPPNGGGYCGASANGCAAARAAGAQCDTGAASGAFGAFGTYGYIHDFRGGADGTQTGLNNSAVCGNRQGNLP